MSASPFVRLARHVFQGRNPLARTGDRVEGEVLLVAVAVVLLGIPVAATVGSETYQSATTESVVQSRTQATATLLYDVPAVGAAVAQAQEVTASWNAPDGSPRSGLVPAAPYLKARSAVSIWVDDTGLIATPPLTSEGAVITAVGAACLLWSLLACLMGALCALTTCLNKRMNLRRWQTHGAETEPVWTARRR